MKQSSKEFLEQISDHCYGKSARYKFARTPEWSKKYAQGQLAALEYINNLCFYYLQKEKNIPEEFKEQIIGQIKKYSTMNDNDYKEGLYDALNGVLDQVNKNCSKCNLLQCS